MSQFKSIADIVTAIIYLTEIHKANVYTLTALRHHLVISNIYYVTKKLMIHLRQISNKTNLKQDIFITIVEA